MKPYTFSRTPLLHHGTNMVRMISTALADYAGTALLVTGSKSFETLPAYHEIMDAFNRRKFVVRHCIIGREPSPGMIDEAVSAHSGNSPAVVVALGGGSVVDGAKAIAAMLPVHDLVKNYLEVLAPRCIQESVYRSLRYRRQVGRAARQQEMQCYPRSGLRDSNGR